MTPRVTSFMLLLAFALSFGSVRAAHAWAPHEPDESTKVERAETPREREKPETPDAGANVEGPDASASADAEANVDPSDTAAETERHKGDVPSPGPVTAAHGVRRFALVVGANDGGPERVRLHYATSDGNLVAQVLRELGGVQPGDIVRLDDPDPEALLQAFTRLAERVQAADRDHTTQFVFYYSGHSDDAGLLLGRKRVSYRELRTAVDRIPADVRIAILDSCASGAFTRLKGGTRQAPFLVATGSDVKGHAFLTSSSADEAAQESDRVGGSFFTHYLTTGLRGAADGNGDRIITLSEAYQFAFDETLARTESTRGGPQHAAYDIQLSGTGDLVMTDLRRTTGRLELAPELGGRVSVRTREGALAAELYKLKGSDPVVLALEPGRYRIVVDDGEHLWRADVTVGGDPAVLTVAKLVPAPVETAVRRGETDLVLVRFDIGLMPVLSLGARHRGTRIHHNVTLSGFWGRSAVVDGLAASLGLSIVDEAMNGVQWAFVGTIVRGKALGVQLGAIWNHAGELHGLQAGLVNHGKLARGAQLGLVNVAGHMQGVQLGLFNYAEDADAQLGILSVTKKGGVHPEVWTSDVAAVHVGLRLPSRYTYSMLIAGLAPIAGHRAWTFGLGFGGHVPLPKQTFFDLDAITTAVLRIGTPEGGNPLAPLVTLRALGGWAPRPRLAVFAGPTLNVMVDRFAGNDVVRPGYAWTQYTHVWREHESTSPVRAEGETAPSEGTRLRLWAGFAAGFRF